MSDTNNIQEFSSCLFEVADKLTDNEYKNMYELLAKVKTELDTNNEESKNNKYNVLNCKLILKNKKLEDDYYKEIQENRRLRLFINTMTKLIFSKDTNGIGDKARRKLYEIFNNASDAIRNFSGYNSNFSIYENYREYITYELNGHNDNDWFNKDRGKIYFGDK